MLFLPSFNLPPFFLGLVLAVRDDVQELQGGHPEGVVPGLAHRLAHTIDVGHPSPSVSESRRACISARAFVRFSGSCILRASRLE